MEEQHVKIVVVGEKGVGKTSLITTIVANSFQEKVAPTIPPVIIPRTEDFEDINVRTEIIDTSSRENDQHKVEEQIKSADFVCIVFDVNVPKTKERAHNYWIPKVKKLNDKIPFGLIGAKSDIRDANPDLRRTRKDLEVETEQILKENNYLEFVVELSAKSDPIDSLDEVFWYAQHGVLYPRTPLCDAELKFTPEYSSALQRIFKLMDSDKDGYLDDKDLKVLQMCLPGLASVEEIKDAIRDQDPESITQRGVMLRGFMTFFHILADRGRREPTWAILRMFGYDKQLKLSANFCCPEINVPSGHYVELSKNGMNFLYRTFIVYQQRQSRAPQASVAGILTRYKLNQLFSLVPEGGQHPWRIFDFPDCCAVVPSLPAVTSQGSDEEESEPNQDAASISTHTTLTNFSEINNINNEIAQDVREDRAQDKKYEAISLDTFLAMWTMTTFYDYKMSMKYLAFIGYPQFKAVSSNPEKVDTSVSSAFTCVKQRDRTVFLACIVGSAGSGKHSLVQSFVGRQYTSSRDDSSTKFLSRFGVGKLKNGCHLVLEVVDEVFVPASSTAPTKSQAKSPRGNSSETKPLDISRLKKADVILLLYDNSDFSSFKYAMRAFSDIEKSCPHVPCLFVANKSDLPLFTKVPQAQSPKGKKINPHEFCRSNALSPPISISVKNNTLNNIFDEAVEAVKSNMGQRRMVRKQKQQRWSSVIRFGGSLVLVIGLCIGAAYLWKQFLKKHFPSPWYALTF